MLYFSFKVYYVSKATLKTANKQYSSLPNDYEMTLNSETTIEPCNDEVDLPTMTFDFVKINELESKQPNAMIGKIVVHHKIWGLSNLFSLHGTYIYSGLQI